jgi:hypothetical protein
MLRLKTVAIAGFLLLGVILLAGTALSQTSAASDAKGGIDFTPIVVALINLAFPVVAGVATYLINAHVKNQQLATQLSNAVQNAVGTVQQHAADSLRGKTELRMTIDDPAIRAGVQYVVDNAAEAITHFKIPEKRIAEKLEAKVGLAAIETNRAASASPVPGISSPLAPVPAIHS